MCEGKREKILTYDFASLYPSTMMRSYGKTHLMKVKEILKKLST